MSKSIGERIKLIRGKLGVVEFADVLGVNRKTITRWEADETLPDGASLLALKEKFGADPGWVLTGEGELPGDSLLSADERLLLERYRESPKPLRDAALRVLLGGEASQRMEGGMLIFHQAPTGDIAARDIVKTDKNRKG